MIDVFFRIFLNYILNFASNYFKNLRILIFAMSFKILRRNSQLKLF